MSPSLLRAFRHPCILLSIAVLLLNDHLFKTFVPSWATGKISDFAGLFFFPFLMGVLLQSWNPKRISSRRALLAGFVLTGIVFTGIKTLPAVNGWAMSLLSHLYGQSVYIAHDATDCMALVVFLPAWKMWLSIERRTETTTHGKMTYLVLAAGSLAALASTPCAPAPRITRLAFDGETLYAGIGFTNRIADGGYILASTEGWEIWHVVMYSEYSENNGSVWRVVPNEQELAKNPFREPRQLPITTCDSAKPERCYRMDGTAKVEESRDGGVSWKTVWQPPLTGKIFVSDWPMSQDAAKSRICKHLTWF